MFDFTPDSKIPVGPGKILIAEPFLADPYFKRSVVLLCEHSDEGSFGFVLNNYIEMDLDQLMDQLPNIDTRISIGGPVKNSNLFYIHSLGNKIENSVPIAEGIYMGGDFDALQHLLKLGKLDRNQIRFFVGYSGWSANQLNEELEQNSWIVGEAAADLLMNTQVEDLWSTILNTMGKDYRRLTNLPSDPKLN
ncbi:MAG: YqgE/AlgH family protein [Flavobacteriales bacterium]|nr:YqgE/AlgH family protein [Flavobacteriales bacterium]